MGGIEYVYWDGARLTPWMKHCLEKLDADLRRLFGVHLVLDPSKGIRLNSEQRAIFLDRYRPQRTGGGPFGDVRWWNGVRYVRHSGLGTVAQPGTSNHEIQGTTAAVDLADSGGAGIGTMGSARSNWLRANASKYGLIPEGFKFNEAWHYAVPNIFTPVPSGGANVTPAPVPEEDDDMIAARITDGQGRKHHAIIGNGYLRHLIAADNPEWMKNVTTSDDKWTEIVIDQLPSVLRSYSCDLHIWDIRDGSFVVLDPITGNVAPGMLWSAVNALRSTVASVKVTSEQTKAYVEKLATKS